MKIDPHLHFENPHRLAKSEMSLSVGFEKSRCTPSNLHVLIKPGSETDLARQGSGKYKSIPALLNSVL